MADVVVAGGGPVAAMLIRCLRDCAVSVLSVNSGVPAGERPIALSWGSRLLLERVHAWPKEPPTAISEIHVSQQGGFGRTVIRAGDCSVPALGYVETYRAILQWLIKEGEPQVRGRVANWNPDADGIEIGIETGGAELRERARLLVLADGGHAAAVDREHDYRQHAVVADVRSERAHRNVAWERFTPSGPIALLPFRQGHALVWSTATDAAHSLFELPDREFLDRLGTAFGSRLGRFGHVGKRGIFPLALRQRRTVPGPRTLLIGNAAQTLHPVAGQGLNIGLRDAYELGELIASAHPLDLGGAAFLRRYASRRQFDREAGIRFTDTLVNLFSNSNAPLGLVRGAGLALLDVLPHARRFLARRMIYGARAFP